MDEEECDLQEEEEEVEENAEADGDVGEPVLGERKRRAKVAAQRRVAAGGRAAVGHGDGSSLEEEAAYHELPAYTHPVADSKGRYPVEISPNEYAVRGLVSFSFPILILSYHRSRKRRALASADVLMELTRAHCRPSTRQCTSLYPPAVLDAYHASADIQAGKHADVHSFRAERGSAADFAGPGDIDEPRLGRQLSKRQMEKVRASESTAGVDHGEHNRYQRQFARHMQHLHAHHHKYVH